MAEYISFQPSDYFNTKIYTGTGSSNAITGVGFQPDLIWIKNRDAADWQIWTDSVRGTDYNIYSNDLNAQENYTTRVQSFDADGFTLGTQAEVNTNTEDFASWNWKGGTTSGIATNGSTTITPSAYSFNQTSGFSIIQYTGNGVAGAKIAHGLGATPNMIIVKKTSSTADWCMYHQRIDSTAPEDYNIKLNTTAARSNNSSFWNDTVPDSVNFTIGDSGDLNSDTTTNIAYCFAEKKGYSKMGSYTGNGNADGTFVYTGFRPGCIMMKRTNGTPNWMLYDSKREGYNQENAYLEPNTNQEEYLTVDIDILSNGFKIRDTATSVNGTPDPYIFSAFAEFPIVSSNDIPGVAR